MNIENIMSNLLNFFLRSLNKDTKNDGNELDDLESDLYKDENEKFKKK